MGQCPQCICLYGMNHYQAMLLTNERLSAEVLSFYQIQPDTCHISAGRVTEESQP